MTNKLINKFLDEGKEIMGMDCSALVKYLTAAYEEGRVSYADRATPVLEVIAREEGRQEAEQEFRKILNSGRKMYELGKQEAYKEIAEIVRAKRIEKPTMFSGQAFTAYECKNCKNKFQWHNTATPILCNICSKDWRDEIYNEAVRDIAYEITKLTPPKNKDYESMSHFHCWQQGKSACGITTDHLRCCLCEERNPRKV